MSSDLKFMERRELRERLNRGEELVLIDVRSSEEFSAGHVDGAINIPAASCLCESASSQATLLSSRSATSAVHDLVEPPNNFKALATAALCHFEVACVAGRMIRVDNS